ncbi:STAS domain-containing protein [Streptomyces sp. NBC_01304]|uniref:STAS domain-containing protein n=1 Tax=Streptomyces sp. NBC_01304 TaxID=2903818 RepID=UPI002E0D81A8|nr:STAS domain-containing protein [Streptomyces sp. NBC_01304]
MALPQLNVYRHDRNTRALITLSGEIDLESVPLLRETLERCLRDGIRTFDIDLTPVIFCDCTGLNAFIKAAQQINTAGGSLQLHYPPPMLTRMITLARCTFLLSSPAPTPATALLPNPVPAPMPATLPVPCLETLRRLTPAAPVTSGGVP